MKHAVLCDCACIYLSFQHLPVLLLKWFLVHSVRWFTEKCKPHSSWRVCPLLVVLNGAKIFHTHSFLLLLMEDNPKVLHLLFCVLCFSHKSEKKKEIMKTHYCLTFQSNATLWVFLTHLMGLNSIKFVQYTQSSSCKHLLPVVHHCSYCNSIQYILNAFL